MAKAKPAVKEVVRVSQREKLKYNMPKALKILLNTCSKEEKRIFKKLMVDIGKSAQ